MRPGLSGTWDGLIQQLAAVRADLAVVKADVDRIGNVVEEAIQAATREAQRQIQQPAGLPSTAKAPPLLSGSAASALQQSSSSAVQPPWSPAAPAPPPAPAVQQQSSWGMQPPPAPGLQFQMVPVQPLASNVQVQLPQLRWKGAWTGITHADLIALAKQPPHVGWRMCGRLQPGRDYPPVLPEVDELFPRAIGEDPLTAFKLPDGTPCPPRFYVLRRDPHDGYSRFCVYCQTWADGHWVNSKHKRGIDWLQTEFQKMLSVGLSAAQWDNYLASYLVKETKGYIDSDICRMV